MVPNEQRGAMFDEFVLGGLIDDADVVIQSARFATWDYKGQVNPPVLALKLELRDDENQVHEDYLSAGDLKFFVPSSDGRKAIPVGSQQKLNLNTNAVEFLISLMNADTRGQLAAKIKGGDDISVIDGTRVHIVRKAQKKRAGLVIQAAEPQPGQLPGQPQREKRVLTVEKVLAYPGEAVGAAGAVAAPAPGAITPATAAPGVVAAAPATAAAPAAPAGSEAVMNAALGTLFTILGEAGGSIKKAQIAGKVFSNADVKLMAAADRNSLLGMIVRDDFLASALVAGAGVKYDQASGTVTLGG